MKIFVAGDDRLAQVLRSSGYSGEVVCAVNGMTVTDVIRAAQDSGPGNTILVLTDEAHAAMARKAVAAGFTVLAWSASASFSVPSNPNPDVVIEMIKKALSSDDNLPVAVEKKPEASLEVRSATLPSLQGSNQAWDSAPVTSSPLNSLSKLSTLPQQAVSSSEDSVKLPNSRRVKIIAFVSPKGGTGRSTLAAYSGIFLARALAKSGRRVLLLDASTQQSDLLRILNVVPRIHLGDLALRGSISKESVHSAITSLPLPGWGEKDRIHAIFSPPSIIDSDPKLLTPTLMNKVLNVLRSPEVSSEFYDYVIVDTPPTPLYSEWFKEAFLPNVGSFILTLTPDLLSLQNSTDWLDIAVSPASQGGLSVERSRLSILLNMEAPTGISPARVRRELGNYNFLGSVEYLNEIRIKQNNTEFNLPDAFTLQLSNALNVATGESALHSILEGDQSSRFGSLFKKLR